MREVGIIEDGALLTENGYVVEVGPTRRIENLASARNARVIDATNKVILPGFVDASTDLLGAARAGRRAPTRTAPPPDLERFHRWFAAQGATTIGVRFTNRKDLLLLRALSTGVPGVRLLYAGTEADGLNSLANSTAQVDLFCPSEGLDSARQLVFSAARRLALGVRVHGPGAEQTGLRGDAHVIENPSFTDPASLEAIAACPSIALWTALSAHRDVARKFLDAGGALALATGFSESSPRTASIPFVLAWAVLEMRLSAAEALSAVTVNAAHALGLARTIGTLESGRLADLVICDCRDYQDVAAHPGVDLVSMVVKSGEVVQLEPRWSR